MVAAVVVAAVVGVAVLLSRLRDVQLESSNLSNYGQFLDDFSAITVNGGGDGAVANCAVDDGNGAMTILAR